MAARLAFIFWVRHRANRVLGVLGVSPTWVRMDEGHELCGIPTTIRLAVVKQPSISVPKVRSVLNVIRCR